MEVNLGINEIKASAVKKTNWLKKIWNKWPGNESIEELLDESSDAGESNIKTYIINEGGMEKVKLDVDTRYEIIVTSLLLNGDKLKTTFVFPEREDIRLYDTATYVNFSTGPKIEFEQHKDDAGRYMGKQQEIISILSIDNAPKHIDVIIGVEYIKKANKIASAKAVVVINKLYTGVRS